MNLQHTIYLSIILVFSCIEPTLLDKDCNGVIGGDALVDDCGSCTGGTTNLPFNYFWGCDGECKGRQFDCTYPGDSTCTSSAPPETCGTACNGDYITDCNDDCIHKDDAREFDLCGVCDPCDNGTKENDCDLWNTTCKGCTDPNAACDSYNKDATVYEQSSCVSSRYYCEIVDNELDITTQTQDSSCVSFSAENECGPGTNICKLFDCTNPDYEIDSTQSLACNVELIAYESWVGNDTCDYYGVLENVLYNFTSCLEFGYDGGTPEANFIDGDCNLVDCRGVHFSDILCEIEFESDPIIDTLINFPPDSVVIQTSTLITYIGGCTDGSYRDITTTETLYSYNAENSVVTVIDSTLIGLRGWLGDGECDSDSLGDLFKKYGLDFNCIEHDYEGGDCVNATSRNKSHNQNLIKSNNISLLISKREEKIKNIINKQR